VPQQGLLKRVEALRSELSRSSVDAINHVMLYFANKITFDEYFSLKKYIILIPAVLFTLSGIDTFSHLYQAYLSGQTISEIPSLSLIPLAAYFLSISIETVIIYLNIRDVIIYKEKKKGLSFLGKIKHILQVKKNPILLTILTENFITFTSTTIPIFCQLLYLFSPNLIWSLMGGAVIGFIQL
jgi:zinc transporter 9